MLGLGTGLGLGGRAGRQGPKPGSPVNTVAPVYSKSGTTFSCTTGTWTNSPTGYTYQHYRNGDAIPGAVNATREEEAADGGAQLYCRVFATNAISTNGANSNTLQQSSGMAMTQLQAQRIYQRSSKSGSDANKGSGTITVPITLTAQASRIEYRLRDALATGNPVLKDWTTALVAVPANTVAVPCTGVPAQFYKYFVDLRANSDNAQILLGTSPVMMGADGLLMGQSQAQRFTETLTGTSFPLAGQFCSYVNSSGVWAAVPANRTGLNPWLYMESLARGVPVGVAFYCVGGSVVSSWLPGTGANNPTLVARADALAGFEFFHAHIGGTDAGSNTDWTTYIANMRTIVNDLEDNHNPVWGRTVEEIYTSTTVRQANTNSAASIESQQLAMRNLAIERNGGFYEGWDINMADEVHQDITGNPYYAYGLARAFTALRTRGALLAGPTLGAGTMAGNVITMAVNKLTDSGAIVVTGNPNQRFTVYNAGNLTTPLPITSVTSDGNNVILTLASAPSGNVDVWLHRFPDPYAGLAADVIRDSYTADGAPYGRLIEPTVGTPVTVQFVAQPPVNFAGSSNSVGSDAGALQVSPVPRQFAGVSNSVGSDSGNFQAGSVPNVFFAGNSNSVGSDTGALNVGAPATGITFGGNSNSVGSDTGALTVGGSAPVLLRTVQIDMGDLNSFNTAGWNNFRGQNANDTMALLTPAGASTGLVVTSPTAWGGSNRSGVAAAGAGVYPDEVVLSAMYASSGQTGRLTLSGCSATSTFDIDMLPSRSGTGTRNTHMIINGVDKFTNALGNANTLVQFTGIAPTAGAIEMSFIGESNFAYVNGMVIREYGPGGAPQPVSFAGNSNSVGSDTGALTAGTPAAVTFGGNSNSVGSDTGALSTGGMTTFTDDFNRADQTLETSPNWTRIGTTAGTLTIVSNELRAASASIGLLQSPDLGSSDHYTEGTWVVTDAVGPMMVVRADSTTNFYGLRVGTTSLQAYKMVAGAFSSIATISVTPVAGDIYRIQIIGNTLTIWRNGSVIGTYTMTAGEIPLSTRQGLVSRTATRIRWLDDYKAGRA